MEKRYTAEVFILHHNAEKGEEEWDDVPAYDEKRFCIVDNETGEVVDDAQGYGYKTPQKAHAAFAYKNRDRSKDAEKIKKDKIIREWMKAHKQAAKSLETFQFEIVCKGSWGPDEHFDAKFIESTLKEWGYTDLPFTGKEYLYAMTHEPLERKHHKKKR